MPLISVPVYGAVEMKSATVTSGAVVALAGFSFTSPYPTDARRATITAGAVAIRVSWSPTNPSATVGHYVAAYGSLTIDGQANVSNLKMISTAGDSVVTVTLER
jgi:hypothetical protein